MKHELIDNTLSSTKAGIVARCICGWVSRPCFTSLIASGLMNDHQEEFREKESSKVPLKIESLTAFIGVGEDGDEGILSYPMEDMQIPLIGADEARISSLRPYAEYISKQYPEMKIKLIRFSHREELE